MSKVSRFPEPKQPYEAYPITVAFELDTGESVADFTVLVVDVADNTDASAAILQTTAPSEAAGVVTVPVQGGTDGHVYKITVRIETSSTPPRLLEKDVLMPVAEL